MSSVDQSIGIIGGGLIGLGWAIAFASCECDVIVYDVDKEVGKKLEDALNGLSVTLGKCGQPRSAPEITRIRCTNNLEDLAHVTFVQECLPERLELKQKVIAGLEKIVGPEIVIATSTSGLSVSDIQSKAKHPDRIVGGHPFNPVYLLPLVEIAGGRLTSSVSVERAAAFYKSLGRQVCILEKESKGFIANRLSRVVWREALSMYQAGVADIATIDRALRYGPGLRWAAQGPFLVYHCAGGQGGIEHFFEQFGPQMQAGFDDLKNGPVVTPQLIQRIIEEVQLLTAKKSVPVLEAERDRLISLAIAAEQAASG